MHGYVQTSIKSEYVKLKIAVREMPDERRNDDKSTTGENNKTETASAVP